jgi:hypothetical protein
LVNAKPQRDLRSTGVRQRIKTTANECGLQFHGPVTSETSLLHTKSRQLLMRKSLLASKLMDRRFGAAGRHHSARRMAAPAVETKQLPKYIAPHKLGPVPNKTRLPNQALRRCLRRQFVLPGYLRIDVMSTSDKSATRAEFLRT